MQELRELLPKLKTAAGNSDFGQDAEKRANTSLDQAKHALKSPNLQTVLNAIDGVNRNLTVFKGFLTKAGP